MALTFLIVLMLPHIQNIYIPVDLEAFYIYLQDKGIISFNEHFPLFKGKYKNIVKGSKKEIIHNLKAEYIPLFINTVVEVVPEIALGVYLQCFGGLRNSEVSAIEYENISFYYMTLVC